MSDNFPPWPENRGRSNKLLLFSSQRVKEPFELTNKQKENIIMNDRTLTTSQIKQYKEALVELSRRLNGTCGETCPMNAILTSKPLCSIPPGNTLKIRIKSSSKRKGWNCESCEKYFHFISFSNKETPCPCNRTDNPAEVIIALEEQIQDFTTQLSTRWED